MPRCWGAALVVVSLLVAGCESTSELGPPAAPVEVDASPQPPPAVELVSMGDVELAGPFAHANLALYLVRGKDTVQGENFLTLDEALERKVLVVHETGSVNELSVDNLSETESIFIQGGEILSGGKQDRMLGVDIVLRPGAKGVKIASFCVEQGRWRRRGSESAVAFYAKGNYAPSKELRLAAKLSKDQAKVWEHVDKSQSMAMSNISGLARDPASPTSLDLTLDDPKYKAAVKAYTDRLAKVVEGKDNVIGFAFAINGKINSADIYGSNALFKKLWPKLLKASAAEAIAKQQKGEAPEPPKLADVKAWLDKPRTGKAVTKALSELVGDGVQAITVETAGDVLLDTKITDGAAAPVHRNILVKDEPAPKEK